MNQTFETRENTFGTVRGVLFRGGDGGDDGKRKHNIDQFASCWMLRSSRLDSTEKSTGEERLTTQR